MRIPEIVELAGGTSALTALLAERHELPAEMIQIDLEYEQLRVPEPIHPLDPTRMRVISGEELYVLGRSLI